MVDLLPFYVDEDSHNILEMQDSFYNQNYPLNAAYWQQGLIDKRFKAGDQSLYSLMYGSNDYYNSRKFFFNLIRRHVSMIAGHQRRNRKSTIAIGIHSDIDDSLTDDYNDTLRWCEDRDGTQEYFSQGFENALDVGMNLLHLYPDYTSDPFSGDLMLDSVSFNNYVIDSFFRKRDLTDCNGIYRRRWVSQKSAQSLLPGRAKDIKRLMPSGLKDGKFSMQAELINLNLSKLYPYDEFYYRDFRTAKMILDPKSGESVEWEPSEENDEEELDYVMRKQPWLIVQETQKPTIKLAISLNGRLMYDGPNLLGVDRYPFVPQLCYYEPDLPSMQWRCQGVVRGMRDAQYLYNRRKVIELSILESQINSGWIYKTDRLPDPKALRQTGEGFLVPIKAGDQPIGDSLQRIDPPGIPESMLELSRSLSEDITKISGVNEELLGAADDDKAGILAMLRQSAGLTTLNSIFDGADYAQRLLGKLRFEAIIKNFNKSKIRKILGREPHAKFFSPSALKYDIAVEEGFYSTTQRQMELKQLLYFKEMGMPISNKSIMRSAIINNKKQVMEEMQQETQQQMQSQQVQQQQQEKVDNAKIMEAYAKSRNQLAAAKEKMASASQKIVEIQEIQSSSDVNKAKAEYELVKQIIELEDMDRAGIRRALETAEYIREQNQKNQIINIGAI